MSEKTEKASPYKLKKAKEQGQVNKSLDLTVSLYLLLFFILLIGLAKAQVIHLQELMRSLFLMAAKLNFSLDNIIRLERFLIKDLLFNWLPFAFFGLLILVLLTLAQTGVVLTSKPLTPQWKRINFIQGAKRLFSIKIFFEALKNTLKYLLIVLVLLLSLKQVIPTLVLFPHLPLEKLLSSAFPLFSKLVFHCLALLIFIGIIDKIFTSWRYAKENRMTKQELKDEYKQREGCPKIKSKIKQLQRELRHKTFALEQVKTADLIVTNPTHLAIALKYERGVMPAPKVLYKARDEQVEIVKKIARQHNIPLIENKVFARALFKEVSTNQWIPPSLYPLAAAIFRNLYTLRGEV